MEEKRRILTEEEAYAILKNVHTESTRDRLIRVRDWITLYLDGTEIECNNGHFAENWVDARKVVSNVIGFCSLALNNKLRVKSIKGIRLDAPELMQGTVRYAKKTSSTGDILTNDKLIIMGKSK